MTTIEDRLTTALHARADLVAPEDLRPPAFPEVGSPGPRRWVYAAVAAACAAAIAVPFALTRDGDGTHEGVPPISEGPTPTETPTPTGTPSPDRSSFSLAEQPDQIQVGGSWQVDLDGGGPDTVTLDGPVGRDQYEDGEVRLTVATTSGGTVSVPLPASYYLFVNEDPIVTSGVPALLVGSSGGDQATYRVFALREGALVELVPTMGDPRLASFEGGATWQRTQVTTDGRLVTLQGTLDGGPEIARAWQWLPGDQTLTAADLGNYCRADGAVAWTPCS